MNLVSIIFNVKIIVYNIVDEYLHCFIINNKNFKTIELLRTGVHYDILFSEDVFETFHLTQNIILDVF